MRKAFQIDPSTEHSPKKAKSATGIRRVVNDDIRSAKYYRQTRLSKEEMRKALREDDDRPGKRGRKSTGEKTKKPEAAPNILMYQGSACKIRDQLIRLK